MALFLELSEDILSSAHLSLEDVRLELALALYASRRLSIGKARELAQIPLWEFRQHLANRRISVDLSPEDLDDDMATLQQLKR